MNFDLGIVHQSVRPYVLSIQLYDSEAGLCFQNLLIEARTKVENCMARVGITVQKTIWFLNWAGAARTQAPTATNYDVGSTTWANLRQAPLQSAM